MSEKKKAKELKLTRLGNSNISYDEDGNIWWEEE